MTNIKSLFVSISFIFFVILGSKDVIAQNVTACGAGKFLSAMGLCESCPAGQYQNQFYPSVRSCTPCPEGTFFPLPGGQNEDVCIQCPPNTFALEGSSTCTPCPEGQASGIARTRCDICPIDTKVTLGAHSTSTVCESCSDNQFTTKVNSPRCESVAEICPPNQILPPGSSDPADCKLCPAGTGPDGDRRECEPCQPGFFSDGSIFTTCTSCAKGFFSDVTASKQCQPCPAGTFTNGLQSLKCSLCPTGTQTIGTGNQVCRQIGGECPKDFFADSFGDCRVCSRVERYNPTTNACEPCEPGSISTGLLDQTCRSCSIFSRQDQESFGCNPPPICPDGKELVDGRCIRCSLNAFRTESMEKCESCPVNTFRVSSTQSCSKCPTCQTRSADELFCKLNIEGCAPPVTGCESDVFTFKADSRGRSICECPKKLADFFPVGTTVRCTPFGYDGPNRSVSVSADDH